MQTLEADSPDAGFALARCQPHRAMHVPALMVARSHEGLLGCGRGKDGRNRKCCIAFREHRRGLTEDTLSATFMNPGFVPPKRIPVIHG
jgi:hypothetical protein